ncbi:fructose-6-phosphate aldolase [Candidatus Desantisbacteria bacterium]|nr:fructose-6-phosphate aldolase [Candidatus Desantisbacteria bacterium]
MKFFVDSANLEVIKNALELGLADGVTTNPTLIAKEGKDFKKIINDICKIVDGPVNVEVLSMDFEGIIKESRELVKWGSNIVIKIPMTRNGLRAVKKLNELKIKTNVTLIFNASQALLAARAGATYVCPFVGRLDDISHNGMDVIHDILHIFSNYDFECEVIAASIRNPLHVLEAARIGADIVTVPSNVIEQMILHPLTDIGIKKFNEDWKKVQNEK